MIAVPANLQDAKATSSDSQGGLGNMTRDLHCMKNFGHSALLSVKQG